MRPGTNVAVVDVEVAARDVLLEIEREEEHRPVLGRELEDDRRVVGHEQVDREQQVVDVDRRGRSVDDPVAQGLRDLERLAHERVHPDDADRVLLDAHGVQGLVVEQLHRVRGALRAVAAEGRREQDRHVAAHLGEGVVRRLPPGFPRRRVEEAVHPRDPGRGHARLGDPERLRVEGDLRIGADDGMRVVLVDPRVRTRPAGLADAAVADRLERAPRVPELDDPDVRVVDPVDDRLVVVDDDDVGAGEQPRQAHAIEESATLGDAGLEERQELVLAVQPPLDHPVMDDLEVAPEIRARVGAEQDPPAGPAGGRPEDPEQHAEQAQAQDPQWAQQSPQRRRGGCRHVRGLLGIVEGDLERDRAVVRIDRRHGPELAAGTEREAAAVARRIDPVRDRSRRPGGPRRPPGPRSGRAAIGRVPVAPGRVPA